MHNAFPELSISPIWRTRRGLGFDFGFDYDCTEWSGWGLRCNSYFLPTLQWHISRLSLNFPRLSHRSSETVAKYLLNV